MRPIMALADFGGCEERTKDRGQRLAVTMEEKRKQLRRQAQGMRCSTNRGRKDHHHGTTISTTLK